MAERAAERPSPPVILLIQPFLDELRRRDHLVTPTTLFRIQKVLESLPSDVDRETLRDYLAPLLISSPDQRSTFDEAFDVGIPATLMKPSEAGSSNDEQERTASKKRKGFRALVFLLAIALVVGFGAYKMWEDAGKKLQPGSQAGSVAGKGFSQVRNLLAGDKVVEQGPPEDRNPDVVVNLRRVLVAPGRPVRPKLVNALVHRKLEVASALASVIVLSFLLALFSRMRRKSAASRAASDTPPFYWDMHVTQGGDLFSNPPFWRMARVLRRTIAPQSGALDAAKSVQATIKSAGFPQAKFRPTFRQAENLVLIERESRRDHLARLFGDMTTSLRKYGMHSDVYYYHGDPRVCEREDGSGRVGLAKLAARHGDSRLLLYGTGRRFIDLVSGRAPKWAELLRRWETRINVTPIPPRNWGETEFVVSDSLTVTYAEPGTIVSAVQSVAIGQTHSLDRVTDRLVADTNSVSALRQQLGEPVFQWLCACAAYPELHYQLTLRLGSFLGPFSYSDSLRLFRLPWFRTGAMPDEVRLMLLAELKNKEAVHEEIAKILTSVKPPKGGSRVARRFRLEFLLQQWLANASKSNRKELKRELKKTPSDEVLSSGVMIRELSRRKLTMLDYVLPAAVKKLLFPGGISALGVRSRVPLGGFILASVGILGAYGFSTNSVKQPTVPPTYALDFPLDLGELTIDVTPAAEAKKVSRKIVFVNAFADDPTMQTTVSLDNKPNDFYRSTDRSFVETTLDTKDPARQVLTVTATVRQPDKLPVETREGLVLGSKTALLGVRIVGTVPVVPNGQGNGTGDGQVTGFEITKPENRSRVSGVVPVHVSKVAPNTVLLVDGEEVGRFSDTGDLDWDTTKSGPRPHNLVAKFTDSAGKEQRTRVVRVQVAGGLVETPVVVERRDNGIWQIDVVVNGKADNTVLLVDGKETDTKYTFKALGNSFKWNLSWDTNNVADGGHVLAVRAEGVGTSPSINVNIGNELPVPKWMVGAWNKEGDDVEIRFFGDKAFTQTDNTGYDRVGTFQVFRNRLRLTMSPYPGVDDQEHVFDLAYDPQKQTITGYSKARAVARISNEALKVLLGGRTRSVTVTGSPKSYVVSGNLSQQGGAVHFDFMVNVDGKMHKLNGQLADDPRRDQLNYDGEPIFEPEISAEHNPLGQYAAEAKLIFKFTPKGSRQLEFVFAISAATGG